MGLFKRWRAKRAAKKQLKEQAKTETKEEVVLKEEKVAEVKAEQAQAKSTPKNEVKEEKDEASKKDSKQRYHVSQNKNPKNANYKRWGVRLSSSKKTIKYHDTQKEAIDHAEELAKANNTSIVIHKLDGTIRKQNY